MKKDKQTLIKWIGNSLLGIGAVTGLLTLITTWRLSQTLPAGVCPYTNTQTWMYLAIALILASLVLSFFEGPHKPKK